MSEAEKAYRAAEEAIARAKAEGTKELSFDSAEFRALDRIPPQIAELTGLKTLSLSNTQITNLAPLAGMTGLQTLSLDNTQITDLAPLAGLIGLRALGLSNTQIKDLTQLVALTELKRIWINDTQISDLTPLGGMTGLQLISFNNSQVNDLAPLAGLVGLLGLFLNNTQVIDLRPIARLEKLSTVGVVGHAGGALILDQYLGFQNTYATQRDARVAELANASEPQRTRETLAYLRTLPPWPAPYTPAATPDGSPPQPIGAVPPKVQTATAQIQHLMRNALITRVSALQFAEQIEDALRGVPATDGNQLPEPLQTMAEMADTLRALSEPAVPVFDPMDRAKLELRIAQLEAIVSKLTAQLADEKAAREAAEALAKKDGFLQSYKKGAGLAAGAASISLVTIGVPTAVIFVLGVEHPVVQAFLTVMGRLPKN